MSESHDTEASLFDRVQAARNQVGTLMARRREKDEARHFELRGQQLKAPSESLRASAYREVILKAARIRVQGIDTEALERWRARLQNLLVAFEETPTSILDPVPGDDARKILFEPLAQFSAQIQTALQTSWKSWVLEQQPSISIELLEVLAEVPALATQVAEIRNMWAKLRQVAGELPGSEDEISSTKATADRLVTLWESLAGGGIPSEVVTFLRSAGQRNGAAFALLTTEVADWLRNHDLLDTLRIRLS
ncbi:hypothetical protein [Burkholderia gladioli]|uniref:hypothetical protein n=1 Tax=Burkholderia gladioli TaxID=28095 RepID=UPI002FE297CE